MSLSRWQKLTARMTVKAVCPALARDGETEVSVIAGPLLWREYPRVRAISRLPAAAKGELAPSRSAGGKPPHRRSVMRGRRLRQTVGPARLGVAEFALEPADVTSQPLDLRPLPGQRGVEVL